jgi:hypothetical protein
MVRANTQANENKQVVVIALKSGEKKGGLILGFSAHKLLKTSIEKMSVFGSKQKFMKTKLLKFILSRSL